MHTLTSDELEALRARLPEKDRHRLRPDGLMEPELPPNVLCGGMEAPYLSDAPESQPSASQPTSLENSAEASDDMLCWTTLLREAQTPQGQENMRRLRQSLDDSSDTK